MTSARGYTMVEAIVATTIALVALAAMISLFSATRRMTQAGDLSAALADGAIAMEIMHRDLTQAIQKPDAPGEKIVFVSKDTARFLRAERKSDGGLTAKLVTYRREKTAAGFFKILRKVGAEESALPGTYSAARFKVMPGTGGPFVRVTLHVVAQDAARTGPVKGSDEAVLSSLIRVAGPEMLGAPFFLWPFLDEIKAMEIPAN